MKHNHPLQTLINALSIKKILMPFLVIISGSAQLWAQECQLNGYDDDGNIYRFTYSDNLLSEISDEEVDIKISRSENLFKAALYYEGAYDGDHLVITDTKMLLFTDEDENEVREEKAYKIYDLVFNGNHIKEISWKREDKLTKYPIEEKIQFEWENDNIVKIVEQDFAGSNLQEKKAYYTIITRTFTYGNALNPFRVLNLVGLNYFEFGSNFSELPPVLCFSKNVATSESYTAVKKGKTTEKEYDYNASFTENGCLDESTPDFTVKALYE